MSRLSAIAGIMLLSLVLAGTAAAYYPPEIVKSVVVGFNSRKSFKVYVKGPCVLDIDSISIQGPSQTYTIDPTTQVQGGTEVQAYSTTISDEGVPQDGDYALTVTDKLGRSDSVTVTYSDVATPTLATEDITPANEAYTATTTPTLSITPQGAGMNYFFRIVNYSDGAVIWQSSPSSSNSVVVPSDVLQPDTPYRLNSYVTPNDMTPAHTGLSMSLVQTSFYTGTRADPPSFGASYIVKNTNYGGTPYRVAAFRVPGLAPWNFAGGNFQISLTPPGGGPVVEGLMIRTTSYAPCLYYSETNLGAGTMSEGVYNIALSDNLGNDIDVDRNYLAEAPAFVEPMDIRPLHHAYVGSLTPYITWQPPTGASADWRYVVKLCRYGASTNHVYSTDPLSGNSHKIVATPPLKDNHTYLLNIRVYANPDPMANSYVNEASTWAVVHVDSRLSNPSIHIPTIVH